MVPRVVLRCIEQLDKSHAPFNQPPSQKALLAEQIRVAVADSVQPVRAFAFVGNVEGLGRIALHAKRQFKGRNPGIKLAVVRAALFVQLVQPPQGGRDSEDPGPSVCACPRVVWRAGAAPRGDGRETRAAGQDLLGVLC